MRVLMAACGWIALMANAHGLSAEEVFEKVSPSIVVVDVDWLEASGTRSGLGSGVVVTHHDARGLAGGPDRAGTPPVKVVITNCHVISGADAIYVRHNGKRFAATLSAAAPRFDLCQLSVPDLEAPPVRLGSPGRMKPGARVYSIGAPEGLELSITEGLVSALRNVDGVRMFQSSAPISPGSSGGGLFDDQGNLIGITTFRIGDGQDLNFAVSSENVRQLSLAEHRAPAALAPAAAATLAKSVESVRQSGIGLGKVRQEFVQ
jgi:S1-C subfamily serine protease